jgi:acetoin:2,6-dichlorophenolindophenol oxidoreductase subunit beta
VRAEEAAEALAREGISVALIDPRTLVPLDIETIRASLERTSRLVVVQESPAPGSWGGSLVAQLIAESFDVFDAPPVLVSGDDTPVPYAGVMEQAWIPDAERIGTAIRQLG